MIKRFGILAAFALCLVGAPAALAQLKIAVIHTERAISQSEEAKALLAEVEADLEKERETITALATEIRELRERIATDSDVIAPTELRRVQEELEDKSLEYEYQVGRLQKEVQDRRTELLEVMAPKVEAVLKDLIELEGYDFIMERGGLRYVNSKHDITRRVTEKLNEKRDDTDS